MFDFLHGHYYIASLVVVTLSMLPFALSFEGRRPQTRELVVIAALVAITVAGRAAFFMTPQFKPVVALVIISGAALGPQSGFAVGALSGFVSNFVFGQGPWTPWQMVAFGLIGCLAGLLFRRLAASMGATEAGGGVGPDTGGAASADTGGAVDADTSGGASTDKGDAVKWYEAARLGWDVRARRRVEWLRVAALCAFGFVATFALYGVILDTAALTMFSSTMSKEALLATYLSGVPFNLVHAVSTVIFLAILARPMIEKLERVKKKYGLYARKDGA